MRGWALLCFLLGLMASASADVTVTGYSIDTFASCDTVQFKINGTGLTTGECVFTNPAGLEKTFNTLLSEGGLLCSFDASLEPDEYTFSFRQDNVDYPGPTTVTVTPSPLSPNDTIFLSVPTTYAAGADIVFGIIPYASCLASSICDSTNPSDYTFSFDVLGHPEISISYLGKEDGVCQYQASPVTVKGDYSVVVSISNDTATATFAQADFAIVAGVSSVNQSMAVIDSASLSNVVAGVQACVNITLYDSYNNTVNSASVSPFSLKWLGAFNPTVEQKTLQGENDGVYTLCFLPTKGGQQQLEVRFNSVELRGSPISMEVQPGAFSATSSLLRSFAVCPPSCSNPTLSVSALAGVPSFFTIVPHDNYQNPKPNADDVTLALFTVRLVGSSATFNGTVEKNGSYLKIAFTVPLTGQYALQVAYNGSSLDGGSIPSVAVSPSSPSMANSSFNTSSLTVVAGSPFTVPFTARDAFGNLASGYSDWVARVETSPTTNCSVAETGLGIYTATCSVLVTGTFQLRFLYASVSHPLTKPIIVTSAAVSASTSTFGDFPPTMVSNSTASLTVFKRDLYGNVGGTMQSFQRLQVQIQLRQGSRIIERFSTSDLTDVEGNANAQQTSFSLRAAGNYSISVQLNGAPLSPAEGLSPTILVTPGPTLGSRCTLSPPLNDAVADLSVYLLLEARDAFDNVQIFDERTDFAVKATNLLSPAYSVNCSIAETADVGVYNVTCIPRVVGPYSVVGSYKGQDAFTTGSPVVVVPGEITTATTSFDPSSLGQSTAVAGQAAQILIQARDSASNPLTYAPDFEVVLTSSGTGGGSKRAPVTVVAEKVLDDVQASAGIAVYRYNVSLAGNYTLSVRLNGTHITGSPSLLRVSPAPADVSSIAFNFEADVPYVTKVDQEFALTLSILDQFGNPVNDGDSFTASLIGTDFAGFVATQPEYVGGGEYRLTFQPDQGGLYALTIVVNDVIVPRNVSVEVLSDLGGECTQFESSLNQGQKWDLICNAFDKYGKEKLVGGDKVTFSADRGSVSVVDHGDGRYTVTYSSQSIGKRNLTLYIGERMVAGMPFRPVIIPGAVVLGTVIPAIFVAAIIVVAIAYYVHRRKLKEKQLQSRKRKPQQVFKPGDEGEWSDDEDHAGGGKDPLMPNDEMEEQWFSNTLDGNERLKRAHSLAMFELEDH